MPSRHSRGSENSWLSSPLRIVYAESLVLSEAPHWVLLGFSSNRGQLLVFGEWGSCSGFFGSKTTCMQGLTEHNSCGEGVGW